MTENKIPFPTRGQTYTLAEICKLPLRDSPCLRIMHNDHWEYVQNTNGTDWLCEINPAIANSRWTFVEETYEWIPVFNFARDNELPYTEIVTVERTKWVDNYGHLKPNHYVRFIGDYEPELTPTEEGYNEERKANPLPLPVPKQEVAQVQQVVVAHPSLPLQAVVEVPVTAAMPCYSAAELATDHVKAVRYLEHRQKDAIKFPQVTHLEWQEAVAHEFVQLYQSGHVNRFKTNHDMAKQHWGVFNYFRNRELPPVYFDSYECFVAWALAKFW